MTRTALYRHFDASGALLYVGISVQPLIRLAAHVWSSMWAADVATVKIEWFETRTAAEHAEWAAIKNEAPRCNVKRSQHRPTKLLNRDISAHSTTDFISKHNIIAAIEAHSDTTGLACSTITSRAVGNSRLYQRMVDGGDIRTDTGREVLNWIADKPKVGAS